jgi:hypothetical protein
MATNRYCDATTRIRHSIALASIFFCVELDFNILTGLQHVESLVNLTVLLFGMFSTAGPRQDGAWGGSPTKHTSSLQLHEILEPKQTVECKMTCVQPLCEVDGPAGQLQLPDPCI